MILVELRLYLLRSCLLAETPSYMSYKIYLVDQYISQITICIRNSLGTVIIGINIYNILMEFI